MKPKNKKGWYLYTYDICGECGERFNEFKELITDRPKPTKREYRHIVTMSWCYSCKLQTL